MKSSFPSRLRVLFDVDGVIADFSAMMVHSLVALGIHPISKDWRPSAWAVLKELGYTPAEEKKVYNFLGMRGVARVIHPFPKAISSVKKIAEVADVYFLTSPLAGSETWAFDREWWLKKQFGDELGGKVISTRHKTIVSADYFVDDKVENCLGWARANPSGIAIRWLSYPVVPPQAGMINFGDWGLLVDLLLGVAKDRSR